MSLERLKEDLKGREGWRKLNCIIVIGLYTFLIVGAGAFRQYFWIILIVIAFCVLLYVIFWLSYLRYKEKERRGDEVFGGWVEHEDGKGELIFFYPEEIVPYERLSEVDKNSVDDFVTYVTKLSKEQIKLNLGITKPPELLTYEEIEEKDQEELDELKKEYEERHNKEIPEEEDILETQGDHEDG